MITFSDYRRKANNYFLISLLSVILMGSGGVILILFHPSDLQIKNLTPENLNIHSPDELKEYIKCQKKIKAGRILRIICVILSVLALLIVLFPVIFSIYLTC